MAQAQVAVVGIYIDCKSKIICPDLMTLKLMVIPETKTPIYRVGKSH